MKKQERIELNRENKISRDVYFAVAGLGGGSLLSLGVSLFGVAVP